MMNLPQNPCHSCILMFSDEDPVTEGDNRKRRGALQLGPRKRPYADGLDCCCTLPDAMFRSSGADPLIHYGRHFGQTVHALCSVNALLTNGILRVGELEERPEDTFTHECVVFPPF